MLQKASRSDNSAEADQLWKTPYIFLTTDENLMEKQKEVLTSQPQMSFLHCFQEKVWTIFEGPLMESETGEKLA